ncbi:MAG: hypothetical protein EBR81_09115 [Proteobacteria bacterium]|nr:hypothetical protein [Pseudomonadota bacterium]
MIPPVLGRIAVVLATSLNGGRFKTSESTCFSSTNNNSLFNCASISNVLPYHVVAIWTLTLLSLVFLGLPTLIVPSRDREKGLRLQMPPLFILLCCLLFCLHQLSLGLTYIVSLHACMFALLYPQYDPSFVGGRSWWSLRYLAANGLILFAIYEGPPVPLVRWPGVDDQAVGCAALAHLVGCILPEAFRCFLGSNEFVLGVLGWID